MLNRRSLITLTSTGLAAAATGFHLTAAQDDDNDLPFQNASFIRDLSSIPEATPAATPASTPAVELDLADLRGYVLGDADAQNTLQIYADYRCPHCRAFHVDIEPGLIEDFVSPGRMKIELFDFTVIGVPSFDALSDDSIESVQAAEAAACAAEQGEYLAYRKWLYDGGLQTADGDFADENLIGAAEDLGLDVDQFTTSFLGGVYEDGIIAMVAHGIDRGVQGTPTMILNNAEPFYLPQGGYEPLKEQLEAELD